MANITINNRQNVLSFIKSLNGTNLDIVKSPKTGKFFFAVDDSEGTKGAVSKSLQEALASGQRLNISDIVVADTVMEGSSTHVWLLMKRGEGNSVQSFSL